MVMLAADASKYTQPGWQPSGLGLVIVQAHPPNYGQERSLELMRSVAAAGLPWDAYIYGYLAYTDWLPGALETLDLANAEGLVPRKLWLDVEDVDSGQDWTAARRIAAVTRDLEACDAWLMLHGRLPNTGIYTAAWYWRPYMANTLQFSDRQLWCAQYDNVADVSVFSPFGGWGSCRIKQYAGSQPDGTDLDVLSIEEEAELNNAGGTDVTDEERRQMQDKIDGLSVTIADMADRLGDQLVTETKRASVRKTVVRAVVKQMQAERVQAVGPRP